MKFNFHTLYLIGFLVSFPLIISGCQAGNPTTSDTSATQTPVTQTTQIPTAYLPPEPVDVQLAWFYKPPADDNLLQLVNRFNFFILTKGDEAERDLMIGMGAQTPFLQYLRFEVIQDPGSCNAQPWRNQVAYNPDDFCRISKDHPDWFLLDQNGNRIVNPSSGKDYVTMDPGNAEWRAFFFERLTQSQEDTNWGGVFLDNVEVTLRFREDRNELPANYTTESDYQAAVQGFLGYLSGNYFESNDKLLYANIVARKDDADFTNYLPYLDGAMQESWAIHGSDGYRPADLWEKHMQLAEDTQAMGKFIILVSQGQSDRQDLQQFAFASYLLINNGKAAFRYAHSDYYNQVWLYENYFQNLGQPLGVRFREGQSWRRDFENGTVMVNPVSHAVEILVNP